jgi:hypothetical protein
MIRGAARFFAIRRLRRRLRVLAGALTPSRLLRRLHRLRADPHAIAAGFASGVALSCTPLFGLHILLALGLTWLVRGHLVAAAIGTAIGNPLTFPVIVSGAYGVGAAMLGAPEGLAEAGMGRILRDGFLVTLAGSVPLAIIAYGVSYAALKPAIVRLRAKIDAV